MSEADAEELARRKADMLQAMEAYWNATDTKGQPDGLFFIIDQVDGRREKADPYWTLIACKSRYPATDFALHSMRLMMEIERVGLQASPLRQTLLESLEIHLEALSKMQEAIKVANEMMKP